MLATDDGRELAVEVVTRHEVAAGVLRRSDDVRAVLGRVRPRAVRVARVVGDAAVILGRQGDRPERADARPLWPSVALVPLVALGPSRSSRTSRPLWSLSSRGPCWPSRALFAGARNATQTPRAADVPGDPLEPLVAVAELQVAQRLAVPVRLDAGVDDAVANAELAGRRRGSIAACKGNRRARKQGDARRNENRLHFPPLLGSQTRPSPGLAGRQH